MQTYLASSSSKQQGIQQNTKRLESNVSQVGLTININNKAFRLNDMVKIAVKIIKKETDVETFTYLEYRGRRG